MTTFYEVLGVAPDATPAQVKAAYVRLARAHHPDYHSAASPTVRSQHQRAMQSVNEAWAVLSDPVARRRYDRDLTARAAPFERAPFERAPFERAPWEPFDRDDGDDATDLDGGYVEAPSAPTSARRQVVVVLPTLLFFTGIVLIGFGLVVELLPVAVLGAAAIVAAALGFLVLPLIAMSASARNDRR